jgi:hypothetical protein
MGGCPEGVIQGREQFVIEQDGSPIATLAPAAEPIDATTDKVVAALGGLRMPDSDYADDLGGIHASQSLAIFPEWRS